MEKKDGIEFFPVKSAEKRLEEWHNTLDPLHTKYHEFMRTYLPKGKYDIDYVINLLKILIQQCDTHQLNRHDLPFSLRESCKKLIANLQTEKMGKDNDPRIMVTCPKCKESVVIPRSISHLWKCPCDKGDVKQLDIKEY